MGTREPSLGPTLREAGHPACTPSSDLAQTALGRPHCPPLPPPPRPGLLVSSPLEPRAVAITYLVGVFLSSSEIRNQTKSA